MTKKGGAFIIFGFIAYISILGLWGLVTADRKMSNFENRALSQRPSFSWQKLWDGRFTEQWEQYLVDQFVGRDQWVGLKAWLERETGKLENHNIIYGSNDFLFERLSPPQAQYTRNLEEMKKFVKSRHASGENVYTMFIPQSQAIYEEHMPPYAMATTADSKKIVDDTGNYLSDYATYVPVTNALRHDKDKNVYFRTDHHWSATGAYFGYREFAYAADLTPTPYYALNMELANSSFYGSYYTKANYRLVRPDQLTMANPMTQIPYEVCTSDSKECKKSLYNLDALAERDKYKLYFNGNPAWVKITTEANTGRSISIFKDSFANIMMPYLITHYDTIHMIDMRYFNMRVDEYLIDNPVDDILLLYGVKTIMEDDIFKWMNRGS